MKQRCMALLGAAVATLYLLGGLPEVEAATIKIDDTKSFSVGAGFRSSFSSVENAAPNDTDRSRDFRVDSMRLYTGGQIHKYIKLTFNTEQDSGNGNATRVLDAIAQLEFSDEFNIWAGRLLPPSDRSNLDGPYYLATYDFPFVQNYPALFAGRDNGIAVWGQVQGGKFKYQAGAFEGRTGGSDQSDNLLYAVRLSANIWDPEPGYYTTSTYYGAKDLLSLGLVMMQESDGAGTALAPGDFSGWSVDALMEKKLPSAGVVNVEGAYYNYDLNDVADASLVQGTGYFILAGYLLPNKMGIGQLQPHIRYQSFDADGAADPHTRTEVGVNYVIDGHNARVSVIYGMDDTGADTANMLTVGLQLQI